MRRLTLFTVCALVPLFLSGSAQCATVTIRTTDSVGADSISKVLIIIRSLEGRGEMPRGLTDTSGILSVSDVKPGLYEALALSVWLLGTRREGIHCRQRDRPSE